MKQQPSAILNGLFLGLILSAFAVAGVLLVLAWKTDDVPCEFPGTEECIVESDIAHSVARLQAYASIGFAAVGGGLWLWRRRAK